MSMSMSVVVVIVVIIEKSFAAQPPAVLSLTKAKSSPICAYSTYTYYAYIRYLRATVQRTQSQRHRHVHLRA